MSSKGAAEEEVNLDEVLLPVQIDVPHEGEVGGGEDVLPVLRLFWVAEGGENSLAVPLQAGVLTLKQTGLQLKAAEFVSEFILEGRIRDGGTDCRIFNIQRVSPKQQSLQFWPQSPSKVT